MKSQTRYLTFNTRQRRELRRITDEVASLVRESGIREGMVLVSAMHITAGVFVNDEKVPAVNYSVSAEQLQAGVKLRKGKKVFHKAILK